MWSGGESPGLVSDRYSSCTHEEGLVLSPHTSPTIKCSHGRCPIPVQRVLRIKWELNVKVRIRLLKLCDFVDW